MGKLNSFKDQYSIDERVEDSKNIISKYPDRVPVLPSIWNVFIKQGKDQEEAIVTAQENLGFVERQLTGKKFFHGETIGLVDLAFGWLANLLSVWEEVCGATLIDHEKFPLLLEWIQNFADAPIIKESWPPRDKLITKYQAHHEVYTSKEAPK